MNIKSNIKKRLREKRKNINVKNLSELNLKSFILKSKKNNVIDFALSHINKENLHEIVDSSIYYTKSRQKPFGINQKDVLTKEYDLMFELAKKNYAHKYYSEMYISVNECAGYPWGFDEFLSATSIYENCDMMDDAFPIDVEHLSSRITPEMIINANVDKETANISEVELVARTLLQLIYIKIVNEAVLDKMINKVNKQGVVEK